MPTVSTTQPESSNRFSPVSFRIFLASPGDVAYERQLAREVIDQLRSERRFRGRIDLQVVAWDQPGAGVAMEAGLTPQEAIARGLPQPAECDVVAVILWSRIGTPLPAEYRKPDGEPYLSGTEWEYRNAIEEFQKKGKPNVWIYRRTEEPVFSPKDPQRRAKLDQWDALESFIASLYNPDGSIAGGLNEFATPTEFRRQFEQHLRDRLEREIEPLPAPEIADEAVAPEPIWTGVPYPGLEVFTPEQAPIFFGRGPEVDQLVAMLSDPRVRFLAVVGASGSGKSSLVAAGLIPRLRAGTVGGAPWRDLRFKPAERGDNPFLALAYALKAALGTTGETETEFAAALRAEPDRFAQALDALLADRPAGTELLLVVDQFEESFTLTADPKPFFEWLEAASRIPRLRIVLTLRADFYARAAAEPVLAALLRRDRGTFPLDPPGIAALHEMIAGPARAAGLTLDDGLVHRVLDDAGAGSGVLALVAFCMHELYEKAGKAGRLTLADYQAIGGVAGAVRRRAELALRRLQPGADKALNRLFSHLVEVNEQEVATRRRAAKAAVEDETLVNELTAARLLVTGKGKDDAPTVEVAHEVLLDAWPRLSRWIEQHAESLRARRDLERAAAEWHAAGRPGSGLRTGPLLKRYQGAAQPRSEIAGDYLRACRWRVRRRRAGMAVAGVAIVAALGVFWHVSRSHYPPALATKGLMVESGLWPVNEPEMVEIPAGEFEMGDVAGDGFPFERPVHSVSIGEPFEIGRYEVTFEQYDLFAAATGREKPDDRGWGRGERPVINVSWHDAVAYAQWLAGKTGKDYRLPSEAEWEYAARAGTETSRYWEDASEGQPDAACTYANVFDQGNVDRVRMTYGATWEPFDCTDPFPFTAPVGQFKANEWGLHDVLGNVWEWVEDCWHDSYKGAPDDGRPWKPEDPAGCAARVVRGGSWLAVPADVRSAERPYIDPSYRYEYLGFRLARSF